MESLKLPNMYMTDLGSVYNHLETGAMQIIYGVRFGHLAGLYDRAKADDFIVNVPVSIAGETIVKYIGLYYAIHVDWILINACIMERLVEGKIDRAFIENNTIEAVLAKCGIIQNDEIAPAYCYNSLNKSDIDNAGYAIPIHKVDRE